MSWGRRLNTPRPAIAPTADLSWQTRVDALDGRGGRWACLINLAMRWRCLVLRACAAADTVSKRNGDHFIPALLGWGVVCLNHNLLNVQTPQKAFVENEEVLTNSACARLGNEWAAGRPGLRPTLANSLLQSGMKSDARRPCEHDYVLLGWSTGEVVSELP